MIATRRAEFLHRLPVVFYKCRSLSKSQSTTPDQPDQTWVN
nr:MAG TPA_asm: hypothetical protein [Caudoviricetes sp.]